MSKTEKITLATAWLDGCSGCHMSVLDLDERLIEQRKRLARETFGPGPSGPNGGSRPAQRPPADPQGGPWQS